MKKLICFYIIMYAICISFLSFVHAEERNNNLKEQTVLIEKYIEKYKSQISETSRNYGVRNDEVIKAAVEKLKELEERVEKMSKSNNSDITKIQISWIIDELKWVHSIVKHYLEQKEKVYRENIRKKKSEYTRISQSIIIRIEKISDALSSPLLDKKTLWEKEKLMISSLLILREKNNELKNFYIRDFSSIEEVENEFKSIIRTVKDELAKIQNLLG